jgi:hypothetical protein
MQGNKCLRRVGIVILREAVSNSALENIVAVPAVVRVPGNNIFLVALRFVISLLPHVTSGRWIIRGLIPSEG